METYLDMSKDQYKAFMQLPVEGPMQMLNLLKFKDEVPETGLSGTAQYDAYMAEAMPFIQQANAKVLYYGAAQFTLIGPEGDLEWDKIIIVEYANRSAFLGMVTQEGYPSHLRKLALVDSRLVFCENLLGRD